MRTKLKGSRDLDLQKRGISQDHRLPFLASDTGELHTHTVNATTVALTKRGRSKASELSPAPLRPAKQVSLRLTQTPVNSVLLSTAPEPAWPLGSLSTATGGELGSAQGCVFVRTDSGWGRGCAESSPSCRPPQLFQVLCRCREPQCGACPIFASPF